MLCRGSRRLYPTALTWSGAGNERQRHRWVICRQDSLVLISACVFMWVQTVCARLVSAVIKSLNPHYIRSICSKCSWNILSSLQSYDVTTCASCVTIQIHHHTSGNKFGSLNLSSHYTTDHMSGNLLLIYLLKHPVEGIIIMPLVIIISHWHGHECSSVRINECICCCLYHIVLLIPPWLHISDLENALLNVWSDMRVKLCFIWIFSAQPM